MSQAATVTTRLTELTTHMTAAATALQQGIQDYSKHRESVSQLVSELNELVANAKTDVSITSNVLNRIEQATAKLSTAQLETEKFMHGVAEVLATAHQEFRSSVSNSLSHSNHEFQQKLSAGVSMLSSSIKDLDEVLGSISPIQNVNA
jgi:prophage DNA circulation protein